MTIVKFKEPNKEMPLPSSEMVKTPDGRAYIQKLREGKYKYDLMRTDDPMFNKVWGETVRRREREHARLEQESKDAWQKNKDEREYKNRIETGHSLIRS